MCNDTVYGIMPSPQVVIDDYVLSERMLKEGRDDGILGLPDHLSGDEVIGAKKGVMQQTIEYLKQNYTSAEGYARNIGTQLVIDTVCR